VRRRDDSLPVAGHSANSALPAFNSCFFYSMQIPDRGLQSPGVGLKRAGARTGRKPLLCETWMKRPKVELVMSAVSSSCPRVTGRF
jgi:hypothetical protein